MPEFETAESNLLQQCPWCEYALAGLPTEHQCPECGQPFDRRWRAFFHRGRLALTNRTRRLLYILCCLTVLFIIVDQVKLPILSAENFFVALPAFMIPISIFLVVHSKPPQFVGVGPAGVTVATRRTGGQQVFLWHQVGEAELDVRDRPVLLLNAERVTLTTLGGKEPEECVDFINKYRDDLGLD